MIDRPYWWRGAGRQPRYIAVGERAGRLYPLLDYLTGPRGLAERAALRLPPHRLDGGPLPPDVAQAVEDALRDTAWPHQALLLYTGYYKETSFVGPVVPAAGEQAVFWKAFSDREAAEAEVRRAGLLQQVLPTGTRAAGCRVIGDRLVEYDALARSLRPATRRDLVRCARDLARKARTLPGPVAAPSPVDDAAVAATAVELAGDVPGADWQRLADALDGLGRGELVLSHGDFTRWNVFRTRGGALGVVDYDAVGPRPLLFDVVHLLTQSAVEKGRVPSLPLLRRATHGVLDDAAAERALADSLLWDTCETVQQYLHNPGNRARTGRAAGLKLAAWRACHV